MVLFNYSTRELTAKVVYYGPGLCGKTTNLQYIYDNLPGTVKGKMLSLATKTDRTLFFDFLPIDLGEIRGMRTRIQLYTVPGQVFYNETRRLVLKGADGVVFVADSQRQMMEANADSLANLEENLNAHGMKLSPIPLVLQFNKRDLPNVATVEEMNAALNKYNAPFYESVATTGIGVQDTLKAITKLVLLHLTKKYDPRRPASAGAPVVVPASSTPFAAPAAMPAPAAPSPAVVVPRAAAPEPAVSIPVAASPLGGSAGVQTTSPSPVVLPSMAPGSDMFDEDDEPIVDLVEIDEEALAAAAPEPLEPLLPSLPAIEPLNEPAALFEGGGDVARVASEGPSEVIVPIEVQAGGSIRRFRLRVRLDLSEINGAGH